MKTPKSAFSVRDRVSKSSKPNPDDLLFDQGSSETQVVPAVTVVATDEVIKMRFGSQLPAQTLVRLHRASYWSRIPLNELLDQALTQLFGSLPDADKPLPEKERVKRKLPIA